MNLLGENLRRRAVRVLTLYAYLMCSLDQGFHKSGLSCEALEKTAKFWGSIGMKLPLGPPAPHFLSLCQSDCATLGMMRV